MSSEEQQLRETVGAFIAERDRLTLVFASMVEASAGFGDRVDNFTSIVEAVPAESRVVAVELLQPMRPALVVLRQEIGKTVAALLRLERLLKPEAPNDL